MKFYLKKWFIHKTFDWSRERLENYEAIFDNFEIVSYEESDAKKVVGYLLAYNEKAIKIIYINHKGEIRTKYIPISAVVVIDEKASMLTQCLLYKKQNRKDQKEKTILLVKEALKYAPTWFDGFILNPQRYSGY